jgi:hypothetical protein
MTLQSLAANLPMSLFDRLSFRKFLWWNNKENEVTVLVEIERKEDRDDRYPPRIEWLWTMSFEKD